MFQDARMDFDDEPSPWQLEQLVWSSSELDHERSDGRDEDHFLHSSEMNLVLDTGCFSAKLKKLLDTIAEDDPLVQTTQRKPSVPILQGESRPPPSTAPARHDLLTFANAESPQATRSRSETFGARAWASSPRAASPPAASS